MYCIDIKDKIIFMVYDIKTNLLDINVYSENFIKLDKSKKMLIPNIKNKNIVQVRTYIERNCDYYITKILIENPEIVFDNIEFISIKDNKIKEYLKWLEKHFLYNYDSLDTTDSAFVNYRIPENYKELDKGFPYQIKYTYEENRLGIVRFKLEMKNKNIARIYEVM